MGPTEDLQEGLLVDDRGLGRCLQEIHQIILALQEHDDFLSEHRNVVLWFGHLDRL